MDSEILEDLGLTHAEIKTYITLLEIGSTTAGLILEKSGLQNSVVHRALNTLIEKGLINYVVEGKRKNYQATSPKTFLNYIDDKKKRFESVLPELMAKQSLQEKHETATIYKGVRGVTEVYNLMIIQKGEYNTFGGGDECTSRMGMSWWLNMHAKRVASKLKARQVFDESVRLITKDIKSKPITQIRYLSKDFASFQETVIVGNYVAITVFTENPYSFLISDAKVADSYRKYFELLWDMATP